MAGVWLRSAWARANWARSIPVVLLVALAGAAAMALVAGTRRTDSAPDRYTASYGGDPDLLLYQPYGPPIADSVREIDGVEHVQNITFVAAFPMKRDGSGIFDGVDPFAGDDDLPGSFVVDGRFTDPSAPTEFTLSRQAAAAMDATVGETYDVVSLTQAQIVANAFEDEPAGPRFDATLVGIVGSVTDFDAPTNTLTFSEGFLAALPDVGVVASIVPVYVADGATERVLAEIRELPFGRDVSQLPNRLITPGARDAVQLQATALWIVTIIAAGAAALVAGQLAARHVRSSVGNRAPLQALGFSRRQIRAEAAIEGGIVGVAAAIVAVLGAVLASRLFPFGVVRVFEPDPGVRIDAPVLLVGALALIALVSSAAAATAARPITQARLRGRRVAIADQVAAAGAPPSMVNGVRFAVSRQVRRGTPPLALIGGVAASLIILSGTLVVGMSIRRVIDEPARYGLNYDELLGNQYQPATGDIVTPLAADADVEDLAAVTIGSLTFGSTDVPIWASESVKGEMGPVITDGRAPTGIDEIALGRKSARRLGVGIGDTVTASTADGGSAALTVVGYAVTAAEAGGGAAMTFPAYAALVPDATRNVAALRLRAGAVPDTVTRLQEVAATPSTTLALPSAARGLDRVTPTPFLLAIVVTLLLVALLAVNLIASARERARDLAVMRALGADRRQLRGMLLWQAITVALIGLVVGVPIGVAIGRRVFVLVANNVGVVSAPHVPALVPLGVIATMLAIAVAAAAWPSMRAARVEASTALRRS